MQLKLGKMTNTELAEWFGIKNQSFKNSKQKKLQELKLYADFEEVYGGVIITKILNKDNVEYSKQGSQNYELVKSSFNEEWNDNGIDSCRNVALKIYDKHKKELTITQGTTEVYVRKSRNELYGIPFLTEGSLGKCTYLWCKRENTSNGIRYIELTEEEDKVRKKLMKQYFNADEDKKLFVAEMVHTGEISKEQGFDILTELENLTEEGFMTFKCELERILGFHIVKATLIEKDCGDIDFKETEMLNT